MEEAPVSRTLVRVRLLCNSSQCHVLTWIIRTHARNRSATAAYSRQLIAIEAIVVMIPGKVLDQPAVSITDDGHTTTRSSVLATLMRRHTPNLQRRTNTVPDTIRPTVPPTTAVCRTVIEYRPPANNHLDDLISIALLPLQRTRRDSRRQGSRAKGRIQPRPRRVSRPRCVCHLRS